MLTLLLAACNGSDPIDTSTSADTGTDETTADTTRAAALSMTRIKAHVDLLASDDFAGRTPGSEGHTAAREYILAELLDMGLSPIGAEDYVHPFPLSLDEDRFTFDSSGAVVPIVADTGYNLAAVVPGVDPALSDEYIVLMAHYDHIGVTKEGEIYNGAYDDITGVAALLELAGVLAEAPLARSVLFVITDAEEGGLHGSAAWLADAGINLDDIAFGLSVDPLGRALLPDYWPLLLLGLERSPTLKARWRELAADADMDVTFINRGPIPIVASDQDSFYDLADPIPAIWFVSPGMSWYHTTDDTPETIDYRTIQDHLRFLTTALTDLADDPERHTDLGEQALSPEDADEAVTLLQGVLASTYPTDDERGQIDGFIAELTENREDPAALQPVYVQTAFFLLLDMTQAHPGEVPPPFPE
ncbi:MAG: hypothetical protein ACI8RZ_000350 [Myxococcota bacterium]|jgi:hypothetical protein